MSIERRCEHRCPVTGDLIGKTIMHLLGCHQRDAAVTMLFVVPGEEVLAERPAILDSADVKKDVTWDMV